MILTKIYNTYPHQNLFTYDTQKISPAPKQVRQRKS